MLDYFEDTLTNVGLPDAWLEWKWNDMTRIKNKYVKRESNLEKLNQIQSIIVNQIKSETVSWIKSETASQVQSETTDSVELMMQITVL